MALHLEGGVGDGRRPRGQETAGERGGREEPVLAVRDDKLRLQEELLPWKAGQGSGLVVTAQAPLAFLGAAGRPRGPNSERPWNPVSVNRKADTCK